MKITFVIALAALLSAASASAQEMDHSKHTEHLGASVMPFDLARSIHVFTPLTDGGTQAVTSRDGDPVQVELIRAHLRKEAEAFGRGDYADPSSIHGAAMPGLAELQAGASRMGIAFNPIPEGALVRFTTSDPKLVAALHLWFEAQVRDHGADAMMHGS